MENVYNSRREKLLLASLIFFEIVFLVFLLGSVVLPQMGFVVAGVGEDNVTVVTLLDIGNTFPEILNVTINDDSGTIDLTANSTSTVSVYVIARDFNGEGDIANITAEFFDTSASAYGSADDNNNHYTNNTCVIDYSYGTIYEANATCTFDLQYYANNATWNATVLVTDNSSFTGLGSGIATVNTLLAFALPNTIDYGEVNATEVSPEVMANVTNAGNVELNLTLTGYAVSEGDGLAMNCSLGTVQNISIEYERYNVTSSTPGSINYTQFVINYTNLTAAPVFQPFNLPQRQSDVAPFLDDTNGTFWRIYVPIGVAGSCSGNIIFGAVQGSS